MIIENLQHNPENAKNTKTYQTAKAMKNMFTTDAFLNALCLILNPVPNPIPITKTEQEKLQDIENNMMIANNSSAHYSALLSSKKLPEAERQEYLQKNTEQTEKMLQLMDEEKKITEAAENRFIEDMAGDEQKILEAAADNLKLRTRGEFEQRQHIIQSQAADILEIPIEPIIKQYSRLLGCTPEAYGDYLLRCSRLTRKTLEHYNIPIKNLSLLIGEKVRLEYGLENYQQSDTTEPDKYEALNNVAINSVDYPVDKINNQVFNLLQEASEGQLTLNIDTLAKTEEKKGLVVYSIDFTELNAGISKKLSNYDKRIMVAAAALINNGEARTTISRIYSAMGGTGRPSQKQVQKIKDSLTKMSGAKITLNNIAEHLECYNYDRFEYNGPLLPMETITAYKNGKAVEGAVHFFREPPLVTFAKERKQFTTIAHKLLEAPVNQTEANLAIEDYLIVKISYMKHSKNYSRKMLYSTIYDNIHATQKMQQKRARDTIERYLDYYKSQAFIKDYIKGADGITIKL